MNHPALTWTEDDTPIAAAFADPYFTGGLAESQHVFMAGNGLPGRLRDGFCVAELGFGTGLNLAMLAQAWAGPGTLHYTSFEAFPMRPEDMARALAPFDLALAGALVTGWADATTGAPDGVRQIDLPGVRAHIHVGDARIRLGQWHGRADAWFLDGFAPARNPELWGEALMAQVGAHTNPGGTVATYTAAGHVRRALADAGFSVQRIPGYGRKKHMTTGRMPL